MLGLGANIQPHDRCTNAVLKAANTHLTTMPQYHGSIIGYKVGSLIFVLGSLELATLWRHAAA